MTRAEADAGTTLDERELRRIKSEKHAERWRKRVAQQAALEEAARQAAAAAEPDEITTEEAYAREQKERRLKRYVDEHDDRGKERSGKSDKHKDGSSSKEHKKRSKDDVESESDMSDGVVEPDVFKWGTRKLRCDAEEVCPTVVVVRSFYVNRIENAREFYAANITVMMHANNLTNVVIRAWAMHGRGRARGGVWRCIRYRPK
ncbi:unnamed protein product [Sphagnum balticum]